MRSPSHDAWPRRSFFLEGLVESGPIECETFLLGELLQQVDRNSVRLVEVERQPPRHCGLARAFEAVELSLSDVGARVQGPRELLLFLLKACDHHRLPLDELGG